METHAMLLASILTPPPLQKDAMDISMRKPAIPRRAEIPTTNN
jgi:hypothetical protein